MRYTFNAFGHHNILATHKTTLEFTKDSELSLKGDCIVGVNAGFDLGKLREFIESSLKCNNKKISITINAMSKKKKICDRITAEINPKFNSSREMVIRKTDFASERTFAVRADKAAFELNRELIGFLKEEKSKASVVLEQISF